MADDTGGFVSPDDVGLSDQVQSYATAPPSHNAQQVGIAPGLKASNFIDSGDPNDFVSPEDIGLFDPNLMSDSQRHFREHEYTPAQMQASEVERLKPGAQRALGDVSKTRAFMQGVAQAVPILPQLTEKALDYPTAALGYGEGATTAERYQNLQNRGEAIRQSVEEQRPLSTAAGNIVGSLALPAPKVLTGLGDIAKSTATIAPKAAEWTGNLAGQMGIGGLYGGAQALGQGEDVGKGAEEGLIGGAVGHTLGSALSEGAGAVRGLYNKISNPEREAAKQLASKYSTEKNILDQVPGSVTLSPEEMAAAQAKGMPLTVADIGGGQLAREARTATVGDPTVDAQFKQELGSRFKTQGERLQNTFENMFGGDLDASSIKGAAQEEARVSNKSNYDATFSHPDAQHVWNKDLSELMEAPVFRKYLGPAYERLEAESAIAGQKPPPNPLFSKDPSSQDYDIVKDKNGVPQNVPLSFWDSVKRTMDEAIQKGDAPNYVQGMRNKLMGALESEENGAVGPLYKQTRDVAKKYFGEQDAFDAGQKFFTKMDALKTGDMKNALSNYTDAEKDLFQKGMATDILNKIKENPDNTDVTRMFNSTAKREKMNLAFGEDRASQIEAQIRLEQIANRTKNTIVGNSTTAHNVMDTIKQHAPHIGGAGLGALALYEYGPEALHHIQENPEMAAVAGLGALGAGAWARSNSLANKKILAATGRILAGSDPTKITQGITDLASDKNAMKNLRKINSSVTQASTNVLNKKYNQTPVPVGIPEEEPGSQPIQRKSGGRVSGSDLCKKLLNFAEKKKKETHHLLNQPDETIVHALKLANQRA